MTTFVSKMIDILLILNIVVSFSIGYCFYASVCFFNWAVLSSIIATVSLGLTILIYEKGM